MLKTMYWQDGQLYLLDQTKLPSEKIYLACNNYRRVREAIAKLEVRGAPAIGAAAAFAMVLAAAEINEQADFLAWLAQVREEIISARPTAVNLAWGCQQIYDLALQLSTEDAATRLAKLTKLALKIYDDDIAVNQRIGAYGTALVPDDAIILTHCNAGALATCGWGTALGVVRSAFAKGKVRMVYSDETRPLLQGARLTVYELCEDGIPVTCITDSMAAWTMKTKGVNFVITGADRIAANGDSANKIGTYSLALAAQAHNIPFYIAAPVSTFDFACAKGADIPIEERDAAEIKIFNGVRIAPEKAFAFNPAFDVTPASLISGIICEYGVLRPPYTQSLAKLRQQIAAKKV